MATFALILQAIIAIPKIGELINGWIGQIVAAWVGMQKDETRKGFLDAAALSARATTDEARYVAAQAWSDALKRPRINS